MAIRKFLLLAAGVLVGFSSLQAQLFYNNGADVAVTGGGILFVDGSAENAHGLLSNAGETTIRGTFVNGSTATGGGSAGVYNVYGNWENNDVFTADQSNVDLKGNAQQITGSQSTTFYDLTLETDQAVKTQTLDATVSHTFTLNNCELATGAFKMNVTNPDNAAIARISGFVSSTGAGRLVRATNSTNAYLFPTGWNDNGSPYYRPAEIRPSVSDAQSFEARMGFGDATIEGYDISQKAGNVITVNPHFFHLLKQNGTTAPSDLSIYFDPAADGTWGSIGRWHASVPQWEDLLNATTITGTPLSKVTKAGWTDDGNQPHTLINAKELQALFNFPNVFNPSSSNSDNATFHVIDNYNLVSVEDLKVFDRWGEVVFDSKRDGTTNWDGNYGGKPQPMGNYVYSASIKIINTGEVKTASGNLSLIW